LRLSPPRRHVAVSDKQNKAKHTKTEISSELRGVRFQNSKSSELKEVRRNKKIKNVLQQRKQTRNQAVAR